MAKGQIALFGASVELEFHEVSDEMAELLFPDIELEALRLQAIFNIFSPKSEISRLNKARSLKVSEELLVVLKKALLYSAISNGAYDVSKGKEFVARKKGEAFKANCSYKDIKISGNSVKLLSDDAHLDLGSIAKGYITDMIAQFVSEQGVEDLFIDARGDLIVVGKHPEIVDVQDPRDIKAKAATIVLQNTAVATSGDYKQYTGSYDNSHLVGKKDIISSTVVSDTLMEADALATVLLLLGKAGAKDYLKAHTEHKVMLIYSDGIMETFNGFDSLLVGAQNG